MSGKVIPDSVFMDSARSLWAAVVERAVLDYRKAIFAGDEPAMRTIEKQVEIMGYGSFMPKVKANAERFKREVDREIRRDPRTRCRLIDCPACGSEQRCEIIRRKTSLSAICYSCGIRYHFPMWKLKEDENA